MEFAETVPEKFPELMTPGCQAAPGVFCFAALRQQSHLPAEAFACASRLAADRSKLAPYLDCGFRGRGHDGSLRAAGFRPNAHKRNLSVRYFADQSDGLLPGWAHRTVHHESHGNLSRL